MLFSLYRCEFVEFLRRGMDCFFCCFRVRDDRRPQIHLVSQPINSTLKEPVDSLGRNRLWSVLVSEAEDRDRSQCKEGGYSFTGSPVLDNELKAEAEFLKACGTLPQTPAEIRNTEKLKDSQPHNEDTESTFHSWLPNTTTEKILPKQPDQSLSPIKLFEEWENGSDSSPRSPNSSSEGCGVGHFVKDVASVQCKNKSVRFEFQNIASSSSSEVTNQNLKPSGSPYDHSLLKPSPYPTPLKLTNDMQTPGTAFPSYIHNKETGKDIRIKFQYVYSVVNPHNFSQLEAPMEQVLGSDKETPQEDQKVSWHATPFEERLGNELTDDKFIRERKHLD